MCSSIHDFGQVKQEEAWHWCQTTRLIEKCEIYSQGYCCQHHQRLWDPFWHYRISLSHCKAWLDQTDHRKDLIMPVLHLTWDTLWCVRFAFLLWPLFFPVFFYFITLFLSFMSFPLLFLIGSWCSRQGWICCVVSGVQLSQPWCWSLWSWHTNGFVFLGFSVREDTKPNTGPSIAVCFPLL